MTGDPLSGHRLSNP